MNPMPENAGWFVGAPESNGEYLAIDSIWRRRWIADWIAGEGKRPGRWYIQGRPYCEADGVLCFRPLPRTPDFSKLGNDGINHDQPAP